MPCSGVNTYDFVRNCTNHRPPRALQITVANIRLELPEFTLDPPTRGQVVRKEHIDQLKIAIRNESQRRSGNAWFSPRAGNQLNAVRGNPITTDRGMTEAEENTRIKKGEGRANPRNLMSSNDPGAANHRNPMPVFPFPPFLEFRYRVTNPDTLGIPGVYDHAAALRAVGGLTRGEPMNFDQYNNMLLDYIDMINDCVCHSDCACNNVCVCNNDCGCNYSDRRLKKGIVYC